MRGEHVAVGDVGGLPDVRWGWRHSASGHDGGGVSGVDDGGVLCRCVCVERGPGEPRVDGQRV
eukprot:3873648-Rhodomonas_salina.1